MDPRYARTLIGIAAVIVLLLVALVVVLAGGGGEAPLGASTSSSTTTAGPAPGPTTTTTTTLPPATTTTTQPPATTAPATTATTSGITTTTTTTSTTTTTTTTVPAGPCGGLPSTGIGPGATAQTVAYGDVDGDGADDEIVVYRDAGAWWLNARLDYGWSTEIPLPGTVARAVDVVGLGAAEEVIVAQVDAGASVAVYGFFAFQGCALVHVVDGTTYLGSAFPVGASVTHLDGITCRADGITTTSAAADPDDPAQWEYTETDYLYVPGLAELQPLASSIVLLTSPGDDATIFGAADFDC